ncbi:MAG: rod shape-determining protein MreC [Fluviibacter sp.]
MSGLEQQPPALFKQGPAPLALLILYVCTSIALLVLDDRFRYLEPVRQVLTQVTSPVKQVMQWPVIALTQVDEYAVTLEAARQENAALRHARLVDAEQTQRLEILEAENLYLRKLLETRRQLGARVQPASILYSARDPFNRRVILDRGSDGGVIEGQPVVDDQGVIGQVTRVAADYAEVTLLTDRNQSIPAQVVRNGLRTVVFGTGDGRLEMRYMSSNADVQVGDWIVTSGIDGVYPRGLRVGKVESLESDPNGIFSKFILSPAAGMGRYGEVLLLEPMTPPTDRPASLDRAAEQQTTAFSKKKRKAP